MKPKIKFTAYIATSIDGRIAKNRHSLSTDWTSVEDWKFFQKSLAKHDVVVVGNNTYKVAEKYLKKRNTIVFTSKVSKTVVVGSVVFFNPKYSDILDYFNILEYKNVAILGGSKVYNFFLRYKMLNELYITIEPYIFNSGVAMFSGKFKKFSFLLQSVKKINKKGTLLLKYKYAD